MRRANVFYKDDLAGILTENDEGFEFCYLPDYLSTKKNKGNKSYHAFTGKAI